MSEERQSDGHRQFSVECFNGVWDVLDQSERTEAETELMIDMAHASRYHWQMRDDVMPRNLAVGSWQLSRVYSVAGRLRAATRYAQESLDLCTSNGLSPFFTGYALEALTRASFLRGDSEAAGVTYAAAKDAAMLIEDEEDKAVLLRDVEDAMGQVHRQ
jgi:hypothetical protein